MSNSKVQYWTTEVPTGVGVYWAYEALDSLDADVMLVQLRSDNMFWSIQYGLSFPKDHFSHFMRVIPPSPPTGNDHE